MKERIKEYLADGLKPAQVATLVGCSPSYISQLLKDPDFLASTEELKSTQNKPVDDMLETRYELLEVEIVKSMTDRLAEAEFPHLAKALESVTKARESKDKRRNPSKYSQQPAVTIVPIYVPPHALAAPVLSLNQQSEVVAIDNKPLAPLSAEGVKSLFEGIKARKGEQNEQVIPAIPSQQAKQSAPADF